MVVVAGGGGGRDALRGMLGEVVVVAEIELWPVKALEVPETQGCGGKGGGGGVQVILVSHT